MDWFEQNIKSLCETFGISLPTQAEDHKGGRSDVLKLICPEGEFAMRRLHPTIGEEGAEFIHRATRAMSTFVPEVLCNENTKDGAGYILLNGRCVTLCPWVEGETLRFDHKRKLEVASLLGRLHRASHLYGPKESRSDRPPFCFLPSENNYIFQMDEVRYVLFKDSSAMKTDNPGMENEIDYILSRREDILGWHEEAFSFYDGIKNIFPDMVQGPIHADIYETNLLWNKGTIQCIIDWDECKLESLCYELSRALWEIAGIPGHNKLESAEAFLDAYYRAGGVVPKWELKHAFGFMRAIRTFDLLQYIYCSITKDYYSISYMLKNIQALDTLPVSMDLKVPVNI